MARGLSRRFLDAMRKKLARGRCCGYVGWDQHWKDCSFPAKPSGTRGLLMTRLQAEVWELVLAVHEGKPDKILEEAADVANFAMFVADIHCEVKR